MCFTVEGEISADQARSDASLALAKEAYKVLELDYAEALQLPMLVECGKVAHIQNSVVRLIVLYNTKCQSFLFLNINN